MNGSRCLGRLERFRVFSPRYPGQGFKVGVYADQRSDDLLQQAVESFVFHPKSSMPREA
jgi:hypothetical protein